MSSGDNNPKDSIDVERFQRIDEIAETYLKALHEPSSSKSWRKIADGHPDLAPELEKRLRFIESVYLALQPDSGSINEGSDDPTALTSPGNGESDLSQNRNTISPDRVYTVRCPHCGNLLKVVAQNQTEVTCGSCGSAVSVDPDATRTDRQDRLPKFISHFKILSVIGQGAFGTAYKAEDTRLGRNVAIKVPRAGSFATPNDEFRFVREARNAAQLRHPNIVQVHEIANDNGMPFLVSDLIEGITLSDLISGRRLTFRESAEMMVTIADAVEFAHANHVIHRDLKPSNILLDANNKPFVCDFGLARQTEGEFTVTLEGEILGTPAYMSPEQAAGKDIDVRTDVYSLGVILYRLVCGELPFRGSQRMMIHQVLHDDPKAPRRLDERVPRDLDTIILKAMAKERERRYATANAFAQDLRNWLRSQPIAARPVGVYGKTIRWCRRHPTGAFAAVGTAVLLLTIAGISVAWGLRERLMREVKIEAEANRRESILRLAETHNQNGLGRMLAGDPFGAIPWFVDALIVEGKIGANANSSTGSAAPQLSRLRLGMIEQSLPTLRQVWSLDGKIQALHFSEDGKVLLATSQIGAVQLLDPEGAESVELQKPNNTEIWSSAIDPTGERACTATLENKASLWDLRAGTHLAFLGHDERVFSLSFSSDGKWIATAATDHHVGVWNASDGTLVAKFEHPAKNISFAKFSPDSESLLTASQIDPDHPLELRLWNLSKGELRVPVMTYATSAVDATFDKDGKRIFVATDDGAISIWDTQTGEMIGDPFRQEETAKYIFLTDDDLTLITCSAVGTVSFWDVKNRYLKGTTFRTDFAINAISVDSKNNFLALANSDNRTRVLWQYCGRQVGVAIPHSQQPLAVAFHPDGRRLAIGGADGVVRLWDLAGLASAHDVIRTQGEITALSFTKDGGRLLVGSRENTAQQWDSLTMRPIGAVMKHEDDVVHCEYDAQDRYVVTAGADNVAQVWDASSGNPVGPPLRHESAVLRAKFVPGSDRFITTTFDGSGAIWKVGSAQPLHRFQQDFLRAGLQINPDGKLFALSSEGPFLQIRSTEDGSPIGAPIEHNGLIFNPYFSPSGKKIVSGSVGGTICVTDLDGESITTKRWDLNSSVFAARFVRDDEHVLSGNASGELTMWRLSDSDFVPVWSALNAATQMKRIAIHPQSPVVLAAANSPDTAFRPGVGTVELRDLETGTLLTANLTHYRPIHYLEVSPDGTLIATGSDDGTVRIWDMVSDQRSTDELQKLAYFYNGILIDERLQRRPMDGPTQNLEFQILRQREPERFDCPPDQIQRWADEVQWVRETVAKQKK